MKAHGGGGENVQLNSFLILALNGGKGQHHDPGALTPATVPPVPIH